MLTLLIPQSEPSAETKRSASPWSLVKMQDERPCGTSLLSAIASSRLSYGITYRIGTRSLEREISVCSSIRTMAGSAWKARGASSCSHQSCAAF